MQIRKKIIFGSQKQFRSSLHPVRIYQYSHQEAILLAVGCKSQL